MYEFRKPGLGSNGQTIYHLGILQSTYIPLLQDKYVLRRLLPVVGR